MAGGIPPYGGAAVLADTSAWAWANRLFGDELADWQSALRNQQIATCAVVIYELGQGEFNAVGVAALERRMSALRQLPITRTEWHAALGLMRTLAAMSDGFHRGIRPPDALVAVTAQRYGVGVLHYDDDYDRLCPALGVENHWLASDGSLT